jgi:hypothetical protein
MPNPDIRTQRLHAPNGLDRYLFRGCDTALAQRGFKARFGAEKPENSRIGEEAEKAVETRSPVANGS